MSDENFFTRLLNAWDWLFLAFERVLIVGLSIGGGVLAWRALGAFEVGMWVQIGGALAAMLVTALLVWLAWTIMKFTGG